MQANAFNEKVKAGEARKVSSGFSGKGYKFDASEVSEEKKNEVFQKMQYEVDQVRTEGWGTHVPLTHAFLCRVFARQRICSCSH